MILLLLAGTKVRRENSGRVSGQVTLRDQPRKEFDSYDQG